jgi:hypothetical protein
LRVRLAPFNEWLEYSDRCSQLDSRDRKLGDVLKSSLQARIAHLTYATFASPLAWPERTPVQETMAAAGPYLAADLRGEAVLTLGGAVHEWRHGLVDAVVNVGPHECMPSKIAEAQFFHIAEQEGLLTLSLPLNGDPIDPEILDNFAFEVHARYRRKAGSGDAPTADRGRSRSASVAPTAPPSPAVGGQAVALSRAASKAGKLAAKEGHSAGPA